MRFVLVALLAGRFISFGDGQPCSDEEADRKALDAFYREILCLLLGLVLGAALFCVFVGYAVARTLTT